MTDLRSLSLAAVAATTLAGAPAWAGAFTFSTGGPDGRMAVATRPASTGKIEIEAADDFILGTATSLSSASFTGLLSRGVMLSDIVSVTVEIYRVFPKDSQSPPSGNVPSRVNSPSDVAFGSRSSSAAELAFSAVVLNASFTAANSVRNGIHKLPNQFTGGEGSVSGTEVRFDIDLSSAWLLPADHYFLVPQVEVAGTAGEFYWLSAPKPITGGTGPFAPDLQSWVRSEEIAPDWLRVGTDITGQGPFNAAFSLDGETVPSVPEPQTWALLAAGLGVIGSTGRRLHGAKPR